MDETGTSDAAMWGVDSGYHDVHGAWHLAPSETMRAVLEALGAEPRLVDGRVRAGRTVPSSAEDVWVVHEGDDVDALGRFRLRTEDGGEVDGTGQLDRGLALGYHGLDLLDEDRSIRLIVTPRRCPDPVRAWGWSVQLYSARSNKSWGMGDLGDLASLARWTARSGGGALLVNPLHAGLPVSPLETSPYSPASRMFKSPLLLDLYRVDRALEDPGFAAADRAGRLLTSADRIDRDAVWAIKRPLLRSAFERFEDGAGSDPDFAAYRAEQGFELEAWAAWCVACEMAGPDRSTWPASITPQTLGPTVAADPELARNARFHAWLQWQVDLQLADVASSGVALITDLAVGSDAGGFDTWLWPDAFLADMSAGAPPDVFNTEGQEWGLPPWHPWELRRLGFEPFARLVRSALRHAGGLRMDHVMGLFRLFVVPTDTSPADGCYLRYPSSELLDVLALEAHRAGAFVIGEDLGTVEPSVRAGLAERQILGTKLVWFEDRVPADWPESALGAVSTHDLATIAGAWTGEDVADQRRAGAPVAEDAVDALGERLAGWGDLPRDASVAEAVVAAHRLLGSSPATIVLATLEDAAGQALRPNLPGTFPDQRDNWCIPLPVRIEKLGDLPTTRAIIAELSSRHPAPTEQGAP